MSLHMLPALMFGALILFLLIGYPVAFALGAVGLLFSWIGITFDVMPATLLQALPNQVSDIMQNDTLLSVPFFTFMGLILERSGMAEDMLDTIGQLFGKVRGGLAFAVIFVGALLAATTGVVAASVISMGLISLPIMLRYGYNTRIATGVIAASGTLAQIIPPSLVLIVLGDQLHVPVGDMYAGAMLPGLLLCALYAVYIGIIAMIRPQWVPALPAEARTLHGLALARRALFVMIPPLFLIFLVLGTIFFGWASPTEGGAMGAVGAILLALLNRKLTLTQLKQAMQSTVKLSTFVVFILIGARVFRIAFIGIGGEEWVGELFSGLPGGALGFLIVVNMMVFVLAFFLDFFEIAFILIPLLAPIAQAQGINLTWFGVILAVNMQTSFMHPPFGFALFYLRSVAPASVKSKDIYWGAIPYVVIQLCMVGALIAWPQLVTFSLQNEELMGKEDAELLMNNAANPQPSTAPPSPDDGGAALLQQMTGSDKK